MADSLTGSLTELLGQRSSTRLQTLHPQAWYRLQDLQSALSHLDLEKLHLPLCQNYIRQTLQNKTWDSTGTLSTQQQACLEFCDQFMTSVSSVTDDQISALLPEFTADETYLFVNAIYLLDMSTRLDITMEALL